MKKVICVIACFAFSMMVFPQKNLFVVEDSITGLKGCINLSKKIVIPYEYEELEPVGDGYFVSSKNSKQGLIDSLGNVCVPNLYGYNSLIDTDNKVFFVEKDGKFGLIDFRNRVLIPFQYDEDYHETKKDILKVKRGGKYGLISLKTKKEILQCKYDRIKMGRVLYDDGIVRIDNTRQSDLIAILYNSKWGFVDLDGHVVIPCKYEDTTKLDEDGSEQFDPSRYFYVYQGGRSPFVKKGKVGLLDEKGIEVVPPMYKHINLTGDNNSVDYPTATAFNGKQVLINRENKTFTREYDEIEAVDEDFAVYKIGAKYGLINMPSGQVATEAKYDGFRYPSEGFIRFELNGKYGYINKTGKEVFSSEFDDGEVFNNGYCKVKKDGKYGYIKAHGYSGVYIECQYDDASYVDKNGIALVKKDKYYGALNIMKKILIPMEFDEIKRSDNNLYRVKKSDMYGFYDSRGQIVVPCKYSKDICEVEKRFYLAKQGGRIPNLKTSEHNYEIKVKYMGLVLNDLSASTSENRRLDMNGTPCALVRVMLNDSDPKFEGNITGNIKQRGMQYLVYMSSGSKYLRIAPADHFPIMVSFPDYGIMALESKKTYDLIIVEGSK